MSVLEQILGSKQCQQFRPASQLSQRALVRRTVLAVRAAAGGTRGFVQHFRRKLPNANRSISSPCCNEAILALSYVPWVEADAVDRPVPPGDDRGCPPWCCCICRPQSSSGFCGCFFAGRFGCVHFCILGYHQACCCCCCCCCCRRDRGAAAGITASITISIACITTSITVSIACIAASITTGIAASIACGVIELVNVRIRLGFRCGSQGCRRGLLTRSGACMGRGFGGACSDCACALWWCKRRLW